MASTAWQEQTTQTRTWMSAALSTQLGRQILTSDGLEQALHTAAEKVPAVVGVDAASITLREQGRWRTAASTHNQIVQADQLQYELDQGPCVDATADEEHYVVPDLARDPRWGQWGPQAARLGLGSILAVHVNITAKPVGALNLYTWSRRPYDADDIYLGYLVADQIGATLGAVLKIENMGIGMTQRTSIGQAQGIVMEHYDMDAEPAWRAMVRVSQDNNIKIRDLATEIIRSRQLPALDHDALQDRRRSATSRGGDSKRWRGDE